MYVEVLLALSLLAVSLLAIVPLFVLAARGNAASADLTFAATLAQHKAEELRSLGYSGLTAGSGKQSVNVRSMEYNLTWQIVDDTPQPGMKQVRVLVVPLRPDLIGNARNMEINFYVVP
jgi:hypothetical protein